MLIIGEMKLITASSREKRRYREKKVVKRLKHVLQMSVEKDKEKSTSKYDKARMKRKEQIKLS